MTFKERDLFSVPGQDRHVMSHWERFLAGERETATDVRGPIAESWRRCRHGAVDHRRDSAPPPLAGDRFEELRAQRRHLLEASRPVMAMARDFLTETGTVMVLTDANGTVMNMEGDTALRLQNATEAIHLLPGADWSELTCGTNAIGTALATGLPIQVHATEHFCYGIKKWSCSAAVVRDPFDGTTLGVVDVSGLETSYSRHSMAVVVNAAARIENAFAEIESEHRYRLLERCLARAPRRGDDLVVVFDRFGRPIGAGAELDTALRERGLPVEAATELRLDADGARPAWLREEWLEPVFDGGERLGTVLVVPPRRPAKSPPPRRPAPTAPKAVDAPFTGIVGEDPALVSAVETARRVAPTAAPVLLTGETGVGKERFARSVHAASGAKDGPFVALNCGALGRDLLASELFGYAEGAFTGARKGGMIGKIEAANGGTLFLDELGEMPLDLQPMFLRALEEREICRLGEVTPRRVDFRLVAATNRDLKRDVAEGRFRADLYYRVAVVAIRIPPLRERTGEIPRLVAHFEAEAVRRYGLPARRLSPAAVRRLEAHHWPGNVRELRNVVESALLTAVDDVVEPADLPLDAAPAPAPAGAEAPADLSAMEALERDEIRRTLAARGGNVTATATALGLAKSTVYAKLKRYGIDHGRRRRAG